MPIPEYVDIRGLASALVLFVICTLTGAAVRGRSGARGFDVVVGYAVISALIIALGAAPFRLPLSTAALIVLIGAGLASLLARDLYSLADLARCLVIASPLLVIAAAIPPAYWDDFSHWIPSAAYLYRFDSFPRPDLPTPISQVPAYPYAMPIWTWLASLTSGFFVENAGTICSALFLVAAAAMLVEVVRRESGLQTTPSWWSWAAAGTAVLVMTTLSPSFVKSHALTGHADTLTSVAVASLGLAGSYLLREAVNRADGALRRLVQFSLIAVLLVCLKQVNLVLLAFVCGGLIMLTLRDPWPGKARRLAWLCTGVLPALAFWLLWRRYVSTHISAGEFGWLPLSHWRWSMAPTVILSMIDQAVRKPAHFIVMLPVLWLGTRALLRGARGTADGIALVTMVAFVGYTSFLFAAYVGASFYEEEVRRAASFHRYSTHIGILALVAVTGYSKELARLALSSHKVSQMAIAIAVLAALSPLATWSSLIGLPRPRVFQAQEVGKVLKHELSAGAVVAVIAPHDDGLLPVLLRYVLFRPEPLQRDVRVHPISIARWTGDPLRGALDIANNLSISDIVLHDVPANISRIFGLDSSVEGFAWLSRVATGWQIRQQWKHASTGTQA